MKTKVLQLAAIFLMSSFIYVSAQEYGETIGSEQEVVENELEKLDFSVNIQNNHLWRGLIVTDQPVIMGTLSYKPAEWVEIGLWGASSLSRDTDDTLYKEVNYFVDFNYKNFHIGLWDLYNMRNIDPLFASDDIFNYSKKRTAHILELRSHYTFGPAFPLYLEFDVMLYGGANAGEVFLNPDGSYDKNRHSSYIEVAYPVVSYKGVDLSAFLGGGFGLNDKTHLFAGPKTGFQVSNIGVLAKKDVRITESYTLPVHMMMIWNPALKYARVQFAATLF